MDNKLYKRIKDLRCEYGYKSQQKFADALQVDRSVVRSWEREKKPVLPRLDNLLAMCDLFKCDLDYLVGRIETKTHDIKTVCEITGLSEKAVGRITAFKPYRDLSDLLPADYVEVNGQFKLTKEGIEKAKKKKRHYSIMIPPLSRLIESERFSEFIFAYRDFLDSAEKLAHSSLEPSQQLSDDETIVLNREQATKHYMRNVSEAITHVCEDEFKKKRDIAAENARKMYERMMEVDDPVEDQEDE